VKPTGYDILITTLKEIHKLFIQLHSSSLTKRQQFHP